LKGGRKINEGQSRRGGGGGKGDGGEKDGLYFHSDHPKKQTAEKKSQRGGRGRGGKRGGPNSRLYQEEKKKREKGGKTSNSGRPLTGQLARKEGPRKKVRRKKKKRLQSRGGGNRVGAKGKKGVAGRDFFRRGPRYKGLRRQRGSQREERDKSRHSSEGGKKTRDNKVTARGPCKKVHDWENRKWGGGGDAVVAGKKGKPRKKAK